MSVAWPCASHFPGCSVPQVLDGEVSISLFPEVLCLPARQLPANCPPTACPPRSPPRLFPLPSGSDPAGHPPCEPQIRLHQVCQSFTFTSSMSGPGPWPLTRLAHTKRLNPLLRPRLIDAGHGLPGPVSLPAPHALVLPSPPHTPPVILDQGQFCFSVLQDPYNVLARLMRVLGVWLPRYLVGLMVSGLSGSI